MLNDLAGGNLVGCRSWEAMCMATAVRHISNDELRFLGEELGGETFLFIGLGGLSFFSLKRTLRFLVFHIYPLIFCHLNGEILDISTSLTSFSDFLETSCYILFTYNEIFLGVARCGSRVERDRGKGVSFLFQPFRDGFLFYQ